MITDLTPYRKYVDQFDLTEEQKLELVNSVWMIVESIFDYHLGINQLPIKKRPFDFEGLHNQIKAAAEEAETHGNENLSSRRPKKAQARTKRPRKAGAASGND